MADWAPPAPAGEEREASALLFPEARTMEIPPLAAAMTALLRAVDTPPPRDIYVAGAVARAVAGCEVDTGPVVHTIERVPTFLLLGLGVKV